MIGAADAESVPKRSSPRIGEPYAPPSLDAAVPNWTGWYVGVHGAWHDEDAWALGGHGGYQYQWESRLVLGLEADVAYQWSDSFDVSNATATPEWSGTVRARAGYAVGNLLPYGTAGWGWKSFSMEGDPASSHETVDGFVWGGGVDARLTKVLSARLEYLRWELGDSQLNGKAVDLTDNVLRFGLNLHF